MGCAVLDDGRVDEEQDCARNVTRVVPDGQGGVSLDR